MYSHIFRPLKTNDQNFVTIKDFIRNLTLSAGTTSRFHVFLKQVENMPL